VKTIEEHLIDVTAATRTYVDAYNTRRAMIIEAARDGCTVDQLAEAALLPRPAVAAILGEEL
jgi:hypothetical protein